MKINLSKIFRYSLIVVFNILSMFVIQYYLNNQRELSNTISNLKPVIFINSDSQKTNEELLEQLSNNKFSVVDIIDSKSSEKFVEITPELKDIVNNDFMSFPRIVILNNLRVNNIEEIEQLKNEVMQLDFVDDFIYDQKAYKMFLDNKNYLINCKNIFKYLFIFICFVFVLKLIFFILKWFHRDIVFEIVSGFLLSFISYALICLCTLFFVHINIFILDWQILYIVVPLSFMITLLTKESNV